MANEISPVPKKTSFEDLKRLNDHGAEYWSARDLQPLLGYSQWRRFEDAVKRAVTSCKQSGNDPDHQFADAGKLILGGKVPVKVVQDYHLPRFACYLIAQANHFAGAGNMVEYCKRTRLISARPATRAERTIYEEG